MTMTAKKNAPDVGQDGEGEIQNTNHQEGEPIPMSISETTDTHQPIEPLRPCYGPADERWAALQTWFDEHEQELLDDYGDAKASMQDLTPIERAGWYESRILGRSHLMGRYLRDIEYPAFPDSPTPGWASGQDDAGTDVEDRPVRLWHREIEPRADIPTAVIQLETFDVAADRVVSEPIELSMWIGPDDPTKFTSPERAREVARAILAAADELENVLAFDRIHRGQVTDEQA